MSNSETSMSHPDSTERTAKVKPTPLPKLKMLAIAATLLTESVCTTMLLPFVGLYVAHLQNISVEEAGYSSGVLVGLFMLGQVMSTKLWGWLSDVYGRRAPLTMGLFAGSWTMLFFGMAPNIYVCYLMRFIHGFFNGNVLIAKIIIADITDSTNAALGFSLIGLLWGIGAVVGPAIGGFLYDPLNNSKLQWMHVKEGSYLARNPAFIASLVIFIYGLINFTICLVVLPETNPHRQGSLRNVPVIGFFVNLLRPKKVTIVEVEDATTSVPPPNDDVGVEKPEEMTYMKSYHDLVLYTIIVVLMCICVTDMAFVEIMPLWAIAPQSVGGLGFFSDGVGILMLCCSIPTFASNLLFSKIERKVNNFTILWEGSLILLGVAVFLTPFASLLPDRVAFVYVWVMGSLKNCACGAAFTIEQMLVGRAAPPGTLGAVYGISQSMGALVRCIVPFVIAPLFAWSISGDHSFPFNHYFTFFICILPLFYGLYLNWVNPIERTPEEIAAWTKSNADEVVITEAIRGDWEEDENEETEVDPTAEVISMSEYRSLASSFSISRRDNMLSHLVDIEAARQEVLQPATGESRKCSRGKLMESAKKSLKWEDKRIKEREEHLDHIGRD